jgi:snoRNA binding domain-containing protein (fibrillarin)
VAPAVLLREGRRWRVVDPDRGADGPEESVRFPSDVPEPSGLRRLVSSSPSLLAGDPVVASALRDAKVLRPLAGPAEFARARAAAPRRTSAEWRAVLLPEARAALERALASPEETVTALAREEDRMERARGRDDGAWESFVGPPTGALAEYAASWSGYRIALERHHSDLVRRLEGAARSLAPNLSRVVGSRVAGRLIAAAGGLGPLGRMPASRLQLLGSRRRPGGGRGPRFGLMFRAEGMDRLPPDRQGAYARSLAAMAVIAARADATTRADVAAGLVRRRERRRLQLERRVR